MGNADNTCSLNDALRTWHHFCGVPAISNECESNEETSDNFKLRDNVHNNWPELFNMLIPSSTKKNLRIVQIKGE